MPTKRWSAPLAAGFLLFAMAAVAAPPEHGGADRDQQHGHDEPAHDRQPHDNGGHQPASAPSQAHYQFRDEDRRQLQRHYRRSLGHVDRAHRPQFQSGERIPSAYRRAITPAPQSIRRRLPPPPAGYSVGYYQGYTVVYDPSTYLILSVIDLLTQ